MSFPYLPISMTETRNRQNMRMLQNSEEVGDEETSDDYYSDNEVEVEPDLPSGPADPENMLFGSFVGVNRLPPGQMKIGNFWGKDLLVKCIKEPGENSMLH